jgi:hypothetical protein
LHFSLNHAILHLVILIMLCYPWAPHSHPIVF